GNGHGSPGARSGWRNYRGSPWHHQPSSAHQHLCLVVRGWSPRPRSTSQRDRQVVGPILRLLRPRELLSEFPFGVEARVLKMKIVLCLTSLLLYGIAISAQKPVGDSVP